ncbi:F-type H+-transporting ATPase subunit a [Lactobacillus colini]|uniref:ATP synthase subunit a n=1 Tax=Lactobacillus colini TaxID=1819254 RepID=A0ABS4MDT0_9LACO|nr:F-type H+-transporting ATPase subunit a [Lactobacillus colini]
MSEKPVIVNFLGLNFNLTNCLGGTLMAIAVFALVYYLSRRITLKPNKKQNLLEYLIEFTNNIVKDNVEDEDAQKHLSLYAFTLFLFIFMMNQLGLFLEFTVNEHVLVKSPTADPLITMTMAMMTLLLSFNFGVRKFGFRGYMSNYARPVGFLLPINLIEEFTNFLTLSLRLYGNIYAGEVLLTLIGGRLAKSGGLWTIIASAPLTLIWQGFSVFIGSIQAYVFVTLSMVYIGNKVTQE